MDRVENRKSLAWGVTGLLMQFGAYGVLIAKIASTPGGQETPPEAKWALGAVVFSSLLVIKGLAHYARAKGRASWWGLLGFVGLPGVIILACLRDHARSEPSDAEREASLSLPDTDRVAIASFWCAIVAIIPVLGWPVAGVGIGLGIWSLVRLKRRPDLRGRGRAVFGIVMPFVWTAMWVGILMGGDVLKERARERRAADQELQSALAATKSDPEHAPRHFERAAAALEKSAALSGGADATAKRLLAEWSRLLGSQRKEFDRALAAWNEAGIGHEVLTSRDAAALRVRLTEELLSANRTLLGGMTTDMMAIRERMIQEGVSRQRADAETVIPQRSKQIRDAIAARQSDERGLLGHLDQLSIIRDYFEKVRFDAESDGWMFDEDVPDEVVTRFGDAAARINAELEPAGEDESSPASPEGAAPQPE